MDLLLVRHGVTRHNADRIFMGHDPVPLAPEGRDQVRRLASRLGARKIDRIVASDIARARESAEILSSALGLPFETHAALREVHVGEAEGVSYADAAGRWPEVFDPAGEGRFPGGESFADVADRASAFLRDSVITDEPETVLVVTHGGVVRGAGARLLGLSLRAIGPFAVDNASLTMLRADGPGIWCLTWNDTAHLDAAGTTGRWVGG
ncbi:MAG: histidine phosphatase family protein [Candidatus Binatia bacterium]